MVRLLIIPAIIISYFIIGIILLSIVSKVFKHNLFIKYNYRDDIEGNLLYPLFWPINLVVSLLYIWGKWVIKNGKANDK